MTDDSPATRPHRTAPLILRLVVAGCAAASVLPLLLWVSGAMSFRIAAVVVAAPLMALAVAFAVVAGRRWPASRTAMVAGLLGGLVGTAAYDLFRVPFVAFGGMGLLEPIESYGVLLLGAETSTNLTGFIGWTYHVTNGVGFGVAYALVARGRHWGWGVGWALVLETATVVSPFATSYGLISDAGVRWWPIGLAYAAHVPYGLAIGWAGQHADELSRQAREVTRRPAVVALVLTVLGLALWHRPLLDEDRTRRGRDVASGSSAVIVDARFHPKWLRVPRGDCATVRNDDRSTHVLPDGTSVAPGSTAQLCVNDPGVHRIRLDDAGFTGGFLITDETTGG